MVKWFRPGYVERKSHIEPALHIIQIDIQSPFMEKVSMQADEDGVS